MIEIPQAKIQPITHPYLEQFQVTVDMLREDQTDAYSSGNKLRKLKYNFLQAKKEGKTAVVSMGGAYSNHIYALAVLGEKLKIQTIGVIRGDELANKIDENPTLRFAKTKGMELHFVSRAQFRALRNEIHLLATLFPDAYVLPEGGTNELAVKGCEEILDHRTHVYDYIACPVGTAGTISGIIRSAKKHQIIIGFSALKNTQPLTKTIESYTSHHNFKLNADYCMGGYGKFNEELINFVNQFKKQYQISLEPIYTGKMMYGIIDLIRQGNFPSGSRVLAIHTGGLQGVAGLNQKRIQKNKKPIL